MKSLTIKRVLAIGLLMAGVGHHEAQAMARRSVKRLGIVAAAGLAYAYGYHKNAGPIELFRLHGYDSVTYDRSGKYITGTTIGETWDPSGKVCVGVDVYNAKYGKPVTQAKVLFPAIIHPKAIATTNGGEAKYGSGADILRNPTNSNQHIKQPLIENLFRPTYSIVDEHPSFFTRMRHWSKMATAFVKTKWNHFWSQPKQTQN